MRVGFGSPVDAAAALGGVNSSARAGDDQPSLDVANPRGFFPAFPTSWNPLKHENIRFHPSSNPGRGVICVIPNACVSLDATFKSSTQPCEVNGDVSEGQSWL